MMNFINDAWDFPAERKQIREGRHYLFLRNDDVVSGRLIDFDRDKQTFILQSGSVVPIGQVRRIYLSPHVPAALSGGQGAGQETSSSPWVGTFYRDVPSPPMEIELFGDGTARLTIETARGRTNVLKGRWTDIDGQTVRVNVQSETISSDRRSIVFGLERDTLISLSGSFGANVRLQRR
ncbi:MAG: hypothetical protein FJY82_07885 [Candidatus Aminicenantes bacterium]|nr:hypothetical protein [Candidatus Aminicenantes bacterium]